MKEAFRFSTIYFIFTGNVASYFQYRFVAQENAKPDQHWHYNFHKVTLSATIVFLYATLVPSGLFGALWSSTPKDSPIKPSLIELVCIFGYSLAPFVPASVLWLIQISSIQWIVVLISFLGEHFIQISMLKANFLKSPIENLIC